MRIMLLQDTIAFTSRIIILFERIVNTVLRIRQLAKQLSTLRNINYAIVP